jgi:ribonuclease HI
MSKKTSKTVIIYTDGACSGNPGPGGWAALLEWKGKERVITGGAPHTTNNRMEMRAVIEAMKAVNQPCHIKIHSDSALIVNAFTQGWVDGWLRRNWKKANKKPVENQDLWEEMLTAMQPHDVEWVKVKGHADNERNNRVDRLAVEACEGFK